MAAVVGQPASTHPPVISSVESVSVYSKKEHRQYTAIVQVRVFADSPAEAALLVQGVMLRKETLC